MTYVVIIEISGSGDVERTAGWDVDEEENPGWWGGCFVAELCYGNTTCRGLCPGCEVRCWC